MSHLRPEFCPGAFLCAGVAAPAFLWYIILTEAGLRPQNGSRLPDSLFVVKHSRKICATISPEVKLMDQVKIGKFIARLRRRDGLTQQALGEKLGVTNKTVSRWENGNYMPDIEMLGLLAREFGVSISELLAGESLPEGESGRQSGENVTAASKSDAFSPEERRRYFKGKWRREHIPLLVLLFLVFAASAILPFVLGRPALAALSPVIALIEYGFQNNRMMTYVEKSLFD